MTTTPSKRPGFLSDPVRFRRVGTGVSFLLAGVFTFAGMLATPWESEPGTRAYQDALAASPQQAQIAALLLHFGFLFWAPAVLGALALTRERGVALGHLAAIFAVFGATTMPGLLVVDWYDLALAENLPRDQSVALADAVGDYWGIIVLTLPAILSATIALILASVALWRARHVAIWVPAAMLVGIGILSAGSSTSIGAGVGSAFMLVSFAAMGIQILRMSDDGWRLGRARETAVATAA